MCGILGVYLQPDSGIEPSKARKLVEALYLHSEIRGQESSGLAVKSLALQQIRVVRRSCKAHRFIHLSEVKQILRETISANNTAFSLLGHTRIATNGSLASDNQPIIQDGAVGVHNGIICNVEQLWKQHNEIQRDQEIDTELLFGLLGNRLRTQQGKNIQLAVQQSMQELEGTASFGLLFNDIPGFLIGTNCGSLYYYQSAGLFVFASESLILEKSLADAGITMNSGDCKKLSPMHFGFVSETNGALTLFGEELHQEVSPGIEKKGFAINDLSRDTPVETFHNTLPEKELRDLLVYNDTKLRNLKRCTNCILPETHPFISFDENGVCNYCREYGKRKHRVASSAKEMEELAAKIKSTYSNQGDNCIMMLSGGRDSCYALHLLVKEYGLKPICYSYDWGMLTDLGRRNQVRMCAKLGLEHVIVSADIALKRKNIQRNIKAFMHKPDLGIIGLFMAGDKAVNHYAARLSQEKGLPLFGGVCPLEWTYFKEGFANVRPSFQISRSQRRKDLIKFFSMEVLKNPMLINLSLLDTLKAFKYYYMQTLPVNNVFKYHPWDEETINRTLLEEYNWEMATDTTTTWRIGDGTAALYNYIYATVAGFTENDCFRSNQILEGSVTREVALEKAIQENRPRAESLRWYCDIVGIDMKELIETINRIPRLYS